MSNDYNERLADAMSEGFDPEDAKRVANGRRLPLMFACEWCSSPIEEEGTCADCQLRAQQESAAEDAENAS